jgi:transcriptional regulator with XRE-family HTH domain
MAKTLNQILAANLRAQMEKKGLSANALGKLAGLSPRTIANYLRGDDPEAPASKSGKKRSAKLEEVEMLAAGLEVPAQALLVDADTVQQVVQRAAADLMTEINRGATDHPKAEPRKRRQAGA